MGFDSDESVCQELYLFIKSEGKLYSKRQAVERALAKKFKSGKYDHSKAPAAFGYLVNAGAMEYERQHGSGQSKMPSYFPPVIRRAVAQQFADEFRIEAKLGNFI